jgi:hypothetical protein
MIVTLGLHHITLHYTTDLLQAHPTRPTTPELRPQTRTYIATTIHFSTQAAQHHHHYPRPMLRDANKLSSGRSTLSPTNKGGGQVRGELGDGTERTGDGLVDEAVRLQGLRAGRTMRVRGVACLGLGGAVVI